MATFSPEVEVTGDPAVEEGAEEGFAFTLEGGLALGVEGVEGVGV